MAVNEEHDFEKDFGGGDLANKVQIPKISREQLKAINSGVEDLFFNIGAVDTPRGPIFYSASREGGGTVVRPPPGDQDSPGGEQPPGGEPPPGGGQPPVGIPLKKGKVIPCDNVIIDEADGGNGHPPGGGVPGGERNGPDIFEIPPDLENCVFTQHHRAENGDGWVVIIRIQKGRMKQIVVIDENGNRTPVHRNVGDVIKVHKDNNKITVVGSRKACTYFVNSNRLVCVP
ncbi:hypothetical protein [Microbulbifer aggregans]|uniref:hypothetical protein n=1 Tax=Microbulbifer aggregans TaxID=1769779 RepID=UPI001CFC7ED3|nr:hypothetical protein [Microbulbifer aggregans]